MDSKELATKIALLLDSKKAQNIKVLAIDEVSSLGDYFIIAGGTSTTQVQALAGMVEEKLKEEGVAPTSIEGYRSAGWILLDYTDVIVHIFTTEARDYYDLDRLWSDAREEKIDYPTE